MKDRYFGAPGDSGDLGPDCMERREFLKLGGVRLAGAAVVGSGLTGAGRAAAQSGGSGPLRREFEAAAAEYGVPVEALLAMGYVSTRWEMPAPAVNAYEKSEAEGKETYGIMALVQNPTTDTLGDAAALAGISEARLKTDRAANIRGGAALLAEAAGVEVSAAAKGLADRVSRAKDGLEATNLDSVDRFTGRVTGAVEDLKTVLDAVRDGLSSGSAVAGVGGGELYAEQVRDTLRSGASATISTGERVSLAPAIQ